MVSPLRALLLSLLLALLAALLPACGDLVGDPSGRHTDFAPLRTDETYWWSGATGVIPVRAIFSK